MAFAEKGREMTEIDQFHPPDDISDKNGKEPGDHDNLESCRFFHADQVQKYEEKTETKRDKA